MTTLPVLQSYPPRTTLFVALVALVILSLFLVGCNDNNADHTQPTITAKLSTDANAAGWHNENITVSFQCQDNESGIASCTEPVLLDKEGANQVITGTAIDRAGNIASVSVTLNLDKTSPILSDYQPSDGDTLPTPEINLTGKVDDTLSGMGTVTCDANGTVETAVINNDGVSGNDIFACNLPLNPGSNVITLAGTDKGDNTSTSYLTVYHQPAPNITIDSPDDGALLASPSVTVSGSIDDTSATVMVNDVMAVITNGTFSALVPLENGVNPINAVATNAAGSGTASINVLALVGLSPTVTITAPNSGFVLGENAALAPYPLVVEGWLRDNRTLINNPPTVTILFNNISVPVTLTKQTTHWCTWSNRCWIFNAEKDVTPPGKHVSLAIIAKTGDLITRRERSGIVDFCIPNPGNAGTVSSPDAEVCKSCLYQRPGYNYKQSRRCIVNADGCSAPLGPIKDNPTGGTLGLRSTAFGIDEDPNTPEGQFTVFGQPRPITLPCNRHDECYHQWCPREPSLTEAYLEKQACNDRFYQDMKSVCQKAYPETTCPASRIGLLNCPQWRAEKSSCYAWSRIYADAVIADTQRYLLPGTYENTWPYEGYMTPCEGCSEIK